ncbi:MAG: hypothetical protein WEC34_14440 [Acidimicrobiia bacterium]
MPTFLRGLVALACAGAIVAVAPAAPAGAADADVSAFRGLGTWLDVYDYVPAVQSDGGPPPVSVDSIDDMARLGVRTLYLQSAQDDDRVPGATVDPALLGRYLRRAHEVGIDVVAWYLPKLDDLKRDLRHIRGLASFRSRGERFDGIALDLEWTQGVPDPPTRNAALVKLARRARDVVDEGALGAIVLEPLLLDEVNRQYWPGFPWKKLKDSFDVWLPMSYWTNRDEASGFRDGFAYTEENIRRVRKRLHDPDARVHAIGGIADTAATKDYIGFVKAAERRGAIGYSIYDFNTTTSGVWAWLRDR